MNYLIVRKSDGAVVGTQNDVDPSQFWNLELFKVVEWPWCCVTVHDPLQGVESYDPTVDNPEYDAFVQSRMDFSELVNAIDTEAEWLVAAISQVEIADLAALRTMLKRLMRILLASLRAWKYVIKRFGG